METVVITASAGTFPGLVEALRTLPVVVEERPLIRFRAPPNWDRLDQELDRLGSYDAVAFTSPRAARMVADRIEQSKKESWTRNRLPVVWAAGAATAAALREMMGSVRVPSEVPGGTDGAAAALARAMLDVPVTGPILFPCGSSRRDELPAGLRRKGIVVNEVVCYESVLAGEREALAVAERATVVVVASPSVADLLTRVCPPASRPQLIAAGPTTAASARGMGWTPDAVATEPTAEAVVEAIRVVLRSPLSS